MAEPLVISILTKKYARLSGELEFAECMVEDAVGLSAIIEASNRVDVQKKDLTEKLAAIETVIWLFDPEWDPAKVRPIQPRRRHHRPGAIARAAYSILREAEKPLTVREVARLVASHLNIDSPAEREIMRIHTAVQDDFARREGRTLMIVSRDPARWAMVPRENAKAGTNSRSKPARDIMGKPLRLPPVHRGRG